MVDTADNKEQIDNLYSKVNTMESVIMDFRTQNESVKQALVDIAVALEKIANMEEKIQNQTEEAQKHDNKIQNIEQRLPAIEQTVDWINKGMIGVIGLLGTLFITYMAQTINVGQIAAGA